MVAKRRFNSRTLAKWIVVHGYILCGSGAFATELCQQNNTYYDTAGNVAMCYTSRVVGPGDYSHGKGERELAAETCAATSVMMPTTSRTANTYPLSVNSAEEAEFVANYVQSVINGLQLNTDPDDTKDIASYVYVGAERSGWLDGSDNSYANGLLGFDSLDSSSCFYFSTIMKSFAKTKCGYPDEFLGDQVAVIVCKGRVDIPEPTTASEPTSGASATTTRRKKTKRRGAARFTRKLRVFPPGGPPEHPSSMNGKGSQMRTAREWPVMVVLTSLAMAFASGVLSQ